MRFQVTFPSNSALSLNVGPGLQELEHNPQSEVSSLYIRLRLRSMFGKYHKGSHDPFHVFRARLEGTVAKTAIGGRGSKS